MQTVGVSKSLTRSGLFRYTPDVFVTTATLAAFQPGPATLRLTVFGGQKLLRTPSPRVHEAEVRLAP